MNILVDLDGTVVQYDFAKLLKEHFGVVMPNKSIYMYALEELLGVSSSEVIKMFESEVYAPPNFIPGAKKTLEGFLANNHKVLVYTNRLHFMPLEALESWLTKYDMPFTNIVTNETLPSYAHMYVDDNPVKLMNVGRTIEVKHLLLFDQPWNRRCLNITGKMQRVKNWKQIKEKVNG